ncbi:MAG: hypothetical protein ABIJ81_02200 [Patescibacteria group bacterium]
MKKLALISSLVLGLSLVLAPIASAKGNDQVDIYLSKDEVVAGNYYKAGATVEVAGKVKSDVVAVGGNVIITGEVGGDVIAVGGNVRITGQVAGNVRVVGGNVELVGPVGKNVSVVGGTLTIDTNSQISGHLTLAVGAFEHRGVIKGSVEGLVGGVIIAGTIAGPTELTLDRQNIMQIRETAIIEGPFIYHAGQEAKVAEGAQLAEPLQYLQLGTKEAGRESAWWFGHLVSLFALLIIGMILTVIAPRYVQLLGQTALVKPWRHIGWGFVWLVVPPIAFVILAITVIGLPLAIISAVVYLVGLYITQVVAGMALAEYLKTWPKLTKLRKAPLLLTVSLGIVVFKLLTLIPYMGWVIFLVALLWMWGTIIQVKRQIISGYR